MTVAYNFGSDVAEGWLLNLTENSIKISANEIAKTINAGCSACFPLSGKDLLEEMQEGPELGRELVRLENLWIKSRFSMNKKELLLKFKS